MGTAVRPAKTSPGPWDAFADVDVFVDEVLTERAVMARDGTRPQQSGPKPRLAGAAADHARQLLVISFPRGAWWMSIGLTLGNFLLWAMRREFHIFLHPPEKIIATSQQHGLEPVLDQQGLVWKVAALRRVA